MVRTRKQIARAVKGGIRIRGSACFGVARKGIAVLTLKQLVFQVMGNAFRHCTDLLSINPERGVHRAVTGTEHGICGIVFIFGVQQNPKAGGMLNFIAAIARAFAENFLHLRTHASFSFPVKL